MGQKKIVVAPIFLLLNGACCNIGHIPEILQVYTTHTTYSWNSAKSAQHTLHIPEILWSLHKTHRQVAAIPKSLCTQHLNYIQLPTTTQTLSHLLYNNKNSNNNTGSFDTSYTATETTTMGPFMEHQVSQYEGSWVGWKEETSCCSTKRFGAVVPVPTKGCYLRSESQETEPWIQHWIYKPFFPNWFSKCILKLPRFSKVTHCWFMSYWNIATFHVFFCLSIQTQDVGSVERVNLYIQNFKWLT